MLHLDRKTAIKRANGQVNRIEEHLGYLKDHPTAQAVNHWKGEIKGWLKIIENVIPDMGKKTGAEWAARVAEWYQRLGV